jgi:hypothetical protein
VQCGVAEDGIELARKRQTLRVTETRIDAACPRRFDERMRPIDADGPCTRSDDPLRERTVAATDVENIFARLRREQIDQRRTEVGDETRVTRVAVGFPDRTSRFVYFEAGRLESPTAVAIAR